MKILQMLKREPSIARVRGDMAAKYRELRREEPAKARFLFKRMRAAFALTEQQMVDNVFYRSSPSFGGLNSLH